MLALETPAFRADVEEQRSYGAHEWAGALKHWLRTLPEPRLLPNCGAFQLALEAGDADDDGHEMERAEALRNCVLNLPPEHRTVLRRLVQVR